MGADARSAYGWALGLSLWLSLGPQVHAESSTAASADVSGCEANLTCMRQGKVVSARDFQYEVPNLAHWVRVTAVPVSGPRPAGTGGVSGDLRDPVSGMSLVPVPGACYRTGATTDGPKERARREVCIDPFYIGAFEVTFDAYDRFARETGRELPDDEGWGRGNRPVINVNFYDAMGFAKWLSRSTGVRYRLPTEVEWEHAARAGGAGDFPWGDALGSGRANCEGCGSRWDAESTAPVGSFAPNAWGLYDVIGNVGEWTCSMRDPDPARSFEACDSPYASRRRAYRNGGWSDDPSRVTAHFRDWNAAVRRTDFVGFRLLRECPECEAPARDSLERGRLAERATGAEDAR